MHTEKTEMLVQTVAANEIFSAHPASSVLNSEGLNRRSGAIPEKFAPPDHASAVFWMHNIFSLKLDLKRHSLCPLPQAGMVRHGR